MTLVPPDVPDFRPLPPAGTLPDYLNARIRDPFAFLEGKVVFRARRATAWNVNTGINRRYVPWDTIDEDEAPPNNGWISPTDSVGGASTTLAANTAVGAATFTVASATGLAVGDYVRIGPAGANREHRQIQAVAGTTITPGVPGGAAMPLALAHTSGDAVVEVVSDPSVYLCQATGWYIADASVSIDSSVAITAGQVLIPGIAVNEASPLGVGSPGWEGSEQFMATTAGRDHYVSGLWEFYANAGDRVRLDFFTSPETAGSLAVDLTKVCRLDLCWSGV